MSVLIHAIEDGSVAAKYALMPGHVLISINGREICDVLDYRFHMSAARLSLELKDELGCIYSLNVVKREYQELGLEFESYLIDRQKDCRNKCVFCFIDQLPPGLRASLYFKDDDSRMSFLFGSYITLTNLNDGDIERIIEMRTSPINISVHTMNPALRRGMMGNPRAGDALLYIPKLVGAGICVNAQIVLCPGYNDGTELEFSLKELCGLAPGLQSVSVVPVGITRYRKGLPPMRAFTKDEAAGVIAMIDRFGTDMLDRYGERICWPGDEFFNLAGLDIPNNEYYGSYPQLENGVGMCALLEYEFNEALVLEACALEAGERVTRKITIATGAAAFSLIERLATQVMDRFPGLEVKVVPIVNDFFGHMVTAAGLICGGDLISQLTGVELGDELLIPISMLRHERDLFLDGISLADVEKSLAIPIRPTENDGYALLDAMLGRE